jgi:hypothetical protein
LVFYLAVRSEGGHCATSVVKYRKRLQLAAPASRMKRPASVRVGLAPADANALTSDLTGVLDSASSSDPPPSIRRPGRNPAPAVPPATSCTTLGITPIAPPVPWPVGFETSGLYENRKLTGTSSIRSPKSPNDDGD